MGMYTEFNIDCSLKKDTPKEVIDKLNLLISDEYSKETTECYSESIGYSRNPIIGFELSMKENQYYLKGERDLKNYWSDIDKFVEYIEEYVEEGFGKYDEEVEYEESSFYSCEYITKEVKENGWFAYQLYEEFDIPTFYYLTKEKE